MSLTNTILILTNIPIALLALYAGVQIGQFGKELRLFSGFLFISALIQIPAVILAQFSINNMPLLHIYTAFGGFILIHFYRLLFSTYLIGHVLKITAAIYLIFCVLNSLFWEDAFTFNTNGLIVEGVIIIILSLSTFNLLIREKSEFSANINTSSIAWINGGLFVYFSSNVLLYYFGDYLIKSSMTFSSFRELWILHSLFSITMNCCFFIGLWKSLNR